MKSQKHYTVTASSNYHQQYNCDKLARKNVTSLSNQCMEKKASFVSS